MRTIKQVKSALDKNQRERIELQNKLEDMQKRLELPVLKGKYEGKYFKYRNSAGAGDHWNIYVYCKQVHSVNRAICQRFEWTNEGEWLFHTNHETGMWLFQEEISEKEFNKTALQFISAAQEIMQLK